MLQFGLINNSIVPFQLASDHAVYHYHSLHNATGTNYGEESLVSCGRDSSKIRSIVLQHSSYSGSFSVSDFKDDMLPRGEGGREGRFRGRNFSFLWMWDVKIFLSSHLQIQATPTQTSAKNSDW